MITIVDTGVDWTAYWSEGEISAGSIPEIISELYKQRSNFESRTVYSTEENIMPTSALNEYIELANHMSRLAEQIVNTGPKMANLLSSNDITGSLGTMEPDTVIEEIGMVAGRIQELQAGWAAIFQALNTPVEVYPGCFATPIQIIYRRGTPRWVADYAEAKTLTEK